MDTPIVKLSDEDLETVYEPSEDSFLLIDALEADLKSLEVAKPLTCLEIGSGSGVVITALAMALGKTFPSYCVSVDINVNACKATKRTAALNLVNVEAVQMDLLSCMSSKASFDVVVFNPPYVVTEDEEVLDRSLLSKAWAGGANGRKVMERAFSKIADVLSETGAFYLLVIKENDPEYILRTLRESGLVGTIVAERKIRGEHLYVLRFEKSVTKRA